jgi:hypothetical protein
VKIDPDTYKRMHSVLAFVTRSIITNYLAWWSVDKIDSCGEGFIPEFEWHGGLSKKCESNLYNVVMFPLCKSILLVGMRTGDMVRNTYSLEERIQSLVLTTQSVCMARIFRSNNLSIRF